MLSRMRWSVVAIAAIATPAAHAVPIGLTKISDGADPTSQLFVSEGAAYISTASGVFIVNSIGVASPLTPDLLPGRGPIQRTTRVIDGPDSRLYFAASFELGSALYVLEDISSTVVVWPGPPIMGIDGQLNGYSQLQRYAVDGSISNLVVTSGNTAVDGFVTKSVERISKR